MKKYILVVILSLTLVGCTNKTTSIQDNKIVNELNEKFSYEKGKCLIDNLMVNYSLMNRDDEVMIIDEDDKYYYIDNNNLMLAIDKDFVRTEKDKPFEEYTGFTKSGSRLYRDADFKEEIKTFSLNEKVRIIDGFLNVLVVDNNGEIAYMNQNQVSKSEIRIYIPKIDNGSPSTEQNNQPSNNHPQTPPKQSSGDGEDVELSTSGINHRIHFLVYEEKYSGRVLKDNTIVYITKLQRNDDVFVADELDDNYIILINGRKAIVEKKFIRKDSEEQYEVWNGFTSNCNAYLDYELKTFYKHLNLNNKVKVIDEIDNIYVIELENGEVVYLEKANLSFNEFKIKVEPEQPSQNNGNSNNGSSKPQSPVNPPAPPSEPEPEWTDPVM